MRTTLAVVLSTTCALQASSARADSFFPDEEPDSTTSAGTAASPTASPPRPRHAPDAPAARLGEPGQILVSGSALGSVAKTTFEGSEAAVVDVSVGPGLDGFVARRVSVGLALGAGYSQRRGYGADGSLVDTKVTSISVGARLGYLIPLGDAVSLWPRVTLGVSYERREESLVAGSSLSVASSPIGAPSARSAGPWVSLYVPLLVHLAPHFFVGFGPSVSHDFSHAIASNAASSASAQQTTLGAGLLVGGYFGGPAVAPSADAPSAEATRPRRRFGDVGTVVLTNDLGLGGSTWSYAGTGSSGTQWWLSPGLDYFVSEHVSIGGALGASYAHGSGLQPDGGRVDYSKTALGLTPRLGIEIPLATGVSLWPRLGLTFGAEHQAESAGGKTNSYDLSTLTLDAIAPVLLHVAPHLFLGFGPTLRHDLSGKTSYGSELRATSYGASGVLGGWL